MTGITVLLLSLRRRRLAGRYVGLQLGRSGCGFASASV